MNDRDEQHELEMIQRVHDFLFRPHIEGKPTRAEQIDEALSALRAGKIGGRVVLWMAGVIAAIGALWANVQGFWK